jgi:hypothetical protein
MQSFPTGSKVYTVQVVFHPKISEKNAESMITNALSHWPGMELYSVTMEPLIPEGENGE